MREALPTHAALTMKPSGAVITFMGDGTDVYMKSILHCE
jgi:hypothetical protein